MVLRSLPSPLRANSCLNWDARGQMDWERWEGAVCSSPDTRPSIAALGGGRSEGFLIHRPRWVCPYHPQLLLGGGIELRGHPESPRARPRTRKQPWADPRVSPRSSSPAGSAENEKGADAEERGVSHQVEKRRLDCFPQLLSLFPTGSSTISAWEREI